MSFQDTKTCGWPLAAGAVSHQRILGGKHQCEPQKIQGTQRTGVTPKREAKRYSSKRREKNQITRPVIWEKCQVQRKRMFNVSKVSVSHGFVFLTFLDFST